MHSIPTHIHSFRPHLCLDDLDKSQSTTPRSALSPLIVRRHHFEPSDEPLLRSLPSPTCPPPAASSFSPACLQQPLFGSPALEGILLLHRGIIVALPIIDTCSPDAGFSSVDLPITRRCIQNRSWPTRVNLPTICHKDLIPATTHHTLDSLHSTWRRRRGPKADSI